MPRKRKQNAIVRAFDRLEAQNTARAKLVEAQAANCLLEWRRDSRESLVVLRGVAEKAPLFFRLATILSKGLCGTLYPAMGIERSAAALIHLIRRGHGTIYFHTTIS